MRQTLYAPSLKYPEHRKNYGETERQTERERAAREKYLYLKTLSIAETNGKRIWSTGRMIMTGKTEAHGEIFYFFKCVT
jgi:hypothetical protein